MTLVPWQHPGDACGEMRGSCIAGLGRKEWWREAQSRGLC